MIPLILITEKLIGSRCAHESVMAPRDCVGCYKNTYVVGSSRHVPKRVFTSSGGCREDILADLDAR